MSRLGRPDYWCYWCRRSKRSVTDSFQMRSFSSRAQHHAKEADLKVLKTPRSRKKECCNKEAVSSKPPVVAKHNTCGFKNNKKSLRKFVASKTGFRKFNINRSNTCNNLKASTTVKRQLAYKHFQLPSNKHSSEQEDRERAYTKRRFVIE